MNPTTMNVHPSLQDLADEHRQKFGAVPASEETLRQLAAIPSWASIPPLVVELVNEQLGYCDTVSDDGEVPDLFEGILGGLESLFNKR